MCLRVLEAPVEARPRITVALVVVLVEVRQWYRIRLFPC